MTSIEYVPRHAANADAAQPAPVLAPATAPVGETDTQQHKPSKRFGRGKRASKGS